MQKLTLKIDELRVEQFQVQADADESRGTVHAHVSDAYSDPCRFCPEMPITWTCQE